MTPDKQMSAARLAAVKLLAKRAYSTEGLRRKLLEKGYSETEAGEALESLQEYGYLNDREYAERLTESLKRRGYGGSRVLEALRHKGIAPELARETLDENHNEEENDAQIDTLLRKLGKNRFPDAKEKSRLYAALARRGYLSGDIGRGLRRYIENFEDDGSMDEF